MGCYVKYAAPVSILSKITHDLLKQNISFQGAFIFAICSGAFF
jgi:hypothetical protein